MYRHLLSLTMVNVKILSYSFDELDAFLPDLFVCYSQTFERYKPTIDHVCSIIDGFATNFI